MKNYFKTQPVSSSVAFSFLPLLFISQDIHAYIDAGTGSLIIQFLVAVAVGGFFFIRVFWGKIKALFSKLFAGTGKDTK